MNIAPLPFSAVGLEVAPNLHANAVGARLSPGRGMREEANGDQV